MGDLVTFSDGHKAPALAFGMWQIDAHQVKDVLPEALNVGYRHIDTAYSYSNEGAIGDVLQDYFASGKLKREDVFIATKLWLTMLGKDDVKTGIDESLRRLKVQYLDLVMIHGPFGLKNRHDGTLFPMDSEGNFELENCDLRETWQALEQLVNEGKIRSLGVCNFNSVQLDLISFVAKVKPVLNQVECHAYLPQNELQEFCKKRAVLISAFAALGSPGRPENMISEGEPVLLQESVLETIGAKYGKTPAQVLIRNLLQRGLMVVTKSVSLPRIRENFEVFDFQLSAEDMLEIARLKSNHRFLTFHKMAGAHPQYPFNIPF